MSGPQFKRVYISQHPRCYFNTSVFAVYRLGKLSDKSLHSWDRLNPLARRHRDRHFCPPFCRAKEGTRDSGYSWDRWISYFILWFLHGSDHITDDITSYFILSYFICSLPQTSHLTGGYLKWEKSPIINYAYNTKTIMFNVVIFMFYAGTNIHRNRTNVQG